ncbi:MAG: holo-[acyl-carrier-protein] synthase [Acidobacteria bacterium]|nr:holo-[acyl-carrier-protein] synthase [Acidobacteriota bacterium]
MDILGHGIDVIDIGRIGKLMAGSEDFLSGWFTSRELAALEARGSQSRVVGGRIAAKEAVAKALGSGFAGEVSWQDIEIPATNAGAPTVELSGGAAELARSLGITKFVVSISHSRTVAVASAIAVGSTTAIPSQRT